LIKKLAEISSNLNDVLSLCFCHVIYSAAASRHHDNGSLGKYHRNVSAGIPAKPANQPAQHFILS
jgi:hypothetical protein